MSILVGISHIFAMKKFEKFRNFFIMVSGLV